MGIRIGAPMTFDAYRDKRPAAQARRAITDDVMKAIHALSGQEYVDRYAKRKDVVEAAEPARIAELPTPMSA